MWLAVALKSSALAMSCGGCLWWLTGGGHPQHSLLPAAGGSDHPEDLEPTQDLEFAQYEVSDLETHASTQMPEYKL